MNCDSPWPISQICMPVRSLRAKSTRLLIDNVLG